MKLKGFGGSGPSESSFLPDDYLARRSERRTNALAVFLFVVVTFGVIGAFFVTNRQWNDVRKYQESVNVRYAKAAADIEQLKVLEQQKALLLDKAEVTTALIERVPRSILMAELINRMPRQMTLIDLEVKGERLDKPIQSRAKKKPADEDKDKGASLSKKSKKSKNAVKDEDKEPQILAPRYSTKLIIIGVAPKNIHVASYLRGLQECPLLENVDIMSSDRSVINNQSVFKFRIEADLKDTADARRIEPLRAARLTDEQLLLEDPVLEQGAWVVEVLLGEDEEMEP